MAIAHYCGSLESLDIRIRIRIRVHDSLLGWVVRRGGPALPYAPGFAETRTHMLAKKQRRKTAKMKAQILIVHININLL
jgi:hypothetical protein